MCSASSPSLRLSALPALAFNGEQVLLDESLQLGLREFAAQGVFLDVAGHVFPPQPQVAQPPPSTGGDDPSWSPHASAVRLAHETSRRSDRIVRGQRAGCRATGGERDGNEGLYRPGAC